MLSIGKIGIGQASYYEAKVAEGAEDYYAGEGEAEGYWLGKGSVELELSGKVEPGQLGVMLAGLNPADGQPLGLKSAPGREPVPGFESHLLGSEVGLPDLGSRWPSGLRPGDGGPPRRRR